MTLEATPAPTAGALAADNRALAQRIFQLETLYEIGRESARVERVEDALRIVLSMVMGAFGATGGRIHLEDGTGHTIAALARGGETTATTVRFSLDNGGRGLIALGPRLSGETYSADDSALLETIASNAAIHVRRLAVVAALTAASASLQRKVGALAVVNEIALGSGGHPSAPRLRRFLLEKIATGLRAAEATFVPAEQAPEQTAAYAMAARVPENDTILVRRDAASPPFDGEDRALLQLLANEVGVVLENSRLFDSYLTQQQELFRLRGVLEQYLAPAVGQDQRPRADRQRRVPQQLVGRRPWGVGPRQRHASGSQQHQASRRLEVRELAERAQDALDGGGGRRLAIHGLQALRYWRDRATAGERWRERPGNGRAEAPLRRYAGGCRAGRLKNRVWPASSPTPASSQPCPPNSLSLLTSGAGSVAAPSISKTTGTPSRATVHRTRRYSHDISSPSYSPQTAAKDSRQREVQ